MNISASYSEGLQYVTDKEEIVLDKVVLELSKRQGPIGELLHKGVMRMLSPRALHILSVKDVLEETATSRPYQ